MAKNRVIGKGPDIPWRIPGEQKIFRRLTEGRIVAMGRKTFESIGRALPNRETVVMRDKLAHWKSGISRSLATTIWTILTTSLPAALHCHRLGFFGIP